MRILSSIRGVSFDLWETLITELNICDEKRSIFRRRALANALKRFDVRLTEERILAAENKLTDWFIAHWSKNREVSHFEQIEFIVQHASDGKIHAKKQWLNATVAAYTETLFRFMPKVHPYAKRVLNTLKNHGMKLCLVSNIGRTPGVAVRKFLETKNLAQYFDAMLFSDEVGVRKPSPHIFRLAAKKLGLRPAQIVHVGDNELTDICGAKNAGMKAILLRDERINNKIASLNPMSLAAISRRTGHATQASPDLQISDLTELCDIIKSVPGVKNTRI